jgi:hypothetical protein
MAIYRGTYYSASSCTGSARPGAKALMSWYLGAYGSRGAANLGIYVCKRLGSGYSIHGHGRACDMGTAPYDNPGGNWPDWGWALANALRLNSAELGIQLIIFNGKVWSCRYPDSGFRNYGGDDPHDGHMHVELIPETAESLTVPKIQSVLGGATPHEGVMSMLCKKGDKGPVVGALQIQLAYLGFYTGEKDNDYGPKTSAGVLAMRRSVGSGVDNGDDFDRWAYAQLQQANAKKFGRTEVTPAQIAAAVAAHLKNNPPALPTAIKFTAGTLTGITKG